jgi:hypothetical protein
MMLRGLVHEIVRRKLWPIPVIALLVAVAAPLLFMKSSSGQSPSLAQAPATVDTSSAKSLPVNARRLLRTKPTVKRQSKAGKAADPFQGPASGGSGKSDSAAASNDAASPAAASSAAAGAQQKPVPVVITDEHGKATTTTSGDQGSSKSSGSDSGYVAVDVGFKRNGKGAVRQSVPRLTPLVAKHRIVATFVKYSPSRNKAVFAISPNTYVAGSVKCRREAGLCRYIELSRGKHVLLTILGPGGSLLTRRLSVARIRSRSGAEPRPPLAGRCLLSKLAKLGPGDPAVLSDACD